MASRADVRRIALSLPETGEEPDRFAFYVLDKGKKKGFAWVWQERVHPKKPRVERHYHGYPAVRVWLAEVTAAELRSLLTEAWRCQAPRGLEPHRRRAR